ncbi:MAG TPA: SMC family ATPase, partial [Gemmatimonadaceae bacterium]|nr:SMC family ATPase [Gemmatimonadaceae bacterium]
ERVARELSELGRARQELDGLRVELAAFPSLMQELQHTDALYREDGRRHSLIDHERALVDELARLDERIVKLETAPSLETSLVSDIAARRAELADVQGQAEARRTDWVRDLEEARTKLKALGDQVKELRRQKEQLVHLGPDGECPTCARPLGDHLASVVALLDEQASTLTVDGRYYKDRVKQLTQPPAEVTALDARRETLAADVTTLERRLAKVQAGVQELAALRRDADGKRARRAAIAAELAAIPSGYDGERHARLKRDVERLAPLDARAARLGAAVEREPQLVREHARIVGDLAAAVTRLAELRQRSEGMRFDEGRHAGVRRRWEQAAALVRDAELAAVAARGDMDMGRSAVAAAESARRALDAVQAKLDGLQRERRLHDELDRAYNDLREDLNFQMRPEVSELASGFLTELTDGRYAELELDDQYNIIVLEDGVPKPVISGGEEDLANLVLRLAISQMIAERTGQSFTLLILDEVFGSLDEARRHHVVDLLRRLHDRFEQVIVITHIESVRDGLDRVMMVRFDEARGASAVEVVGEDGELTPPPSSSTDIDAPLWAGAA